MNRLVSLALALGFAATLGACAGSGKSMIPGAPATSIPHRAGGATPAVADAPSTAPVDPQSLYARLGERGGIEAVVADFTNRMARDRRVNKHFAGVDANAFKAKLTDQICQASGGPCQYTGKTMRAAHAGMKITDREWNITVAHLSAAMRAQRVARREQQEVLAVLGPMKNDIVGQ